MWLEDVAYHIDLMNKEGMGQQWEVIAAENPAELLAGGLAHVALARGSGGVIVWDQPLALTVPFTTAWENIGAEEARQIVANGHSLVEVMSWDDVQPNRKALRIDGRLPHQAGYPIMESWSLIPSPGNEEAVDQFAPRLKENPPWRPVVQLAAVGDVMLDRSLGTALQQGDLGYPFAGVVETLANADITLGNIESAVGDIGQPAAKRYTFQAPPEAAIALAQSGFDVVTLANNHSLDFGPEALLQSISLLQQQGIATIGAGANAAAAHTAHIETIHGITLAFLGYANVPVEVGGFDTATWEATASTPGLAWGTPERIAADVAQVLPQADIVTVVLHSGFEYVEAPSPPQVAAARAAIDAGANLVIGHHAHILQGIEYYKEGVILYGTGNFAFQIDGDPKTAIFNLWLDEEGVRQIEIVPVLIQFGGQPRLAESWEAPLIREQVYRLTNLLNTR